MTIYKCKFCGQPTDIDPADQEMPVDYCSHDVLEPEPDVVELCEDEDERDPCYDCQWSDCDGCSFAEPEQVIVKDDAVVVDTPPEPLEKKTYPNLASRASKALAEAAGAVRDLRGYVDEKVDPGLLTHVEHMTMMRLKGFQRHAQDFSFLLRAFALAHGEVMGMEDDSNGLGI